MKITVCVGTGGVGKTSVAAAMALKEAQAGAKCLVLTTDPALRLKTALGLKEGLLEQRVPVPGASGELWAALMDVKATLDDAVRLHAKRSDHEAILHHPIYLSIADSLAGMQELMSIERIDQLIRRGFDNLVIDTAPSRHALDTFDKPQLFAEFSDSGRVRFVSRTYKVAEALGLTTIGRNALEVYSRAESILGATMVRQILDFYSLFHPVAEGYSDRARRTVSILRDSSVTKFRVVTIPSKAVRDAEFYQDALRRREFTLGMICVNRAWLYETPDGAEPGLAGELLDWYRSISRSHRNIIAELKAKHEIRVLRELDRDVEGVESLIQLADQFD